MPLDPSIIMGIKAPEIQSPLDQYSKALTMKSLMSRSQLEDIQSRQAQQEFGDSQALRTATNNHTTVDANGNPSIDQAGVLKDLAQGQNPSLAPKAAMQFAQMNQQMQKQKLETLHANISAAGELLNGVTDQASLDKVLPQIKAMGLDPNGQISPVYDPNNIKFVQGQAMSVKDHISTQIEQQKALNEGKKLDVELFKTFGNPAQGKGNAPPSDPSTLVSRHVPPDRQAKVFDEIDAAQNTARSAPLILKAFDKAASNLHAADFIPGVSNADQKALHALMGPTFKDVEGTVRQAAMDNMNNNTTPQFGDNANTIATKRAALVGYLQSKSSAPTAKGFGIDLKEYPSTRIDPKVLAGDTQKSHKDLPIGSVSMGLVKTANGWVPQQGNANASK